MNQRAEMSDELESSLTEMDWLARLRVGGGLADASLTDGGSEECSSRNTSPDEGSSDFVGQNPFSASQTRRSPDSKPPFSYTHLITAAILSAPTLRMALSEIYQWIGDNYPYYRTAGPGWKVRRHSF